MQGIRIYDNVVEVEVGVDTAIYAANETLFQPVELPAVVNSNGFQPVELPAVVNSNGCVVVTSVVMHDYDDQGVALNLVFLRGPITVGPNQAAMTRIWLQTK
jgi:hypothetical protein